MAPSLPLPREPPKLILHFGEPLLREPPNFAAGRSRPSPTGTLVSGKKAFWREQAARPTTKFLKILRLTMYNPSVTAYAVPPPFAQGRRFGGSRCRDRRPRRSVCKKVTVFRRAGACSCRKGGFSFLTPHPPLARSPFSHRRRLFGLLPPFLDFVRSFLSPKKLSKKFFDF